MAIPDFQSFFKPLLELAADGKEHSMAEARNNIAKTMGLTEDELNERLPSGNQKTFNNRMAWTKSYFVQAGVLESERHGFFSITDRGRDLLKQGHEKITSKVLRQYPEFVDFITPKSSKQKSLSDQSTHIESDDEETPEESIEQAYQSIRSGLAGDILSKIMSNSPQFFENLVVDLMIAMGYGGSRSDAGRAIGKSGDEGIDGIINEDRLGLDVIYLQAKRWQGTVGRPEIQKFVGALHGQRAKKGVFITTGTFSKEADDYVKTIDPKVVLIDGRKLSELMIDYNLGVSTAENYEIKRIDTDYFEEV